MSTGNQLPNLEKIFRDDDEPDFSVASSNLAAIFERHTKETDAHLSTKKQYQRKSNSLHNVPQHIPSPKPEVIIAKAIHAFKLKNGSYTSVGTLGMALIGNFSTKTYQIILYKSKQEHVSVVTVTCDFVYTVQANNYSSYYDSNKDNWSILFENNEICIEFAKEVGLARYFSKQTNMENVIHQDLSACSTDIVAAEGDNVSIKYYITTEIIQPLTTSSVVLQTMTVEISSDDNWERTLIGSYKGLKRILFLPPSKQISLGPGFPKEKTVMLEIEVTDIKTPDTTPPLPKFSVSDKASIISRMAKMGQSMLPKLPTSITTDSEDTEDDAPYTPARHKKIDLKNPDKQRRSMSKDVLENMSKTIHKPAKHELFALDPNLHKPLVAASSFIPQWNTAQIQPNYVTLDGQMHSLPPQTITPTIPTIIDPTFNMLLSETRMSNAEMRMGMAKIADNVQKLLDKFHGFQLQNIATPTNDNSTMDATLKMLLTMNASQSGKKEDNVDKHETIKNISEINQTEILEAKNRIAALEEELKESKEAFANNAKHLSQIKEENESLLHTTGELNKKIQELVDTLKIANNATKEAKEELDMVKQHKEQYEKENAALEENISALLLEHNAMEISVITKQKDEENKNKEIKHIMNKTYQTLIEEFVDEAYSADYIKSTIARIIKNVTLHVLYKSSEKNTRDTNVIKEKSDITSGNIEANATSVNTSSAAIELPKESVADSGYVMGNVIKTTEAAPPPIPPIDKDMNSNCDWLE
ncbi:hypothetical protein KM043_013385 [Ampulex compressa]|nr:hypothetical protein KM043_013385 [Ampulex compressa]